jgi:hypothetical protein
MRFRSGATLLICAAVLAGCSDATSPASSATLLTEIPDIGPTLTIAGPSTLGVTGRTGIASSLGGNPFAIVIAQSGTGAESLICAPTAAGLPRTCTMKVNDLTITYSFAWDDLFRLRTESQMSGTIPAAGGIPSRRISRQSTSWSESQRNDNTIFARMSTRSTETGTSELLGAPHTATADTGSTDIVLMMGPGTNGTAPVPRLIGTSRRVVWTRVPGSPATFWRESTSYDSTSVIRSVIETPEGTKQCTIDLSIAAARPVCN